MAELEVEPISEGNQPGWQVTRGKRRYLLWAPRPAVDHGRTAMGTPMVSPARTDWAAGWDVEEGDAGDHWRRDTLDDVLEPLPGDVEQAFRAAVEEFRAAAADRTAEDRLESLSEADESFDQAGADDA